MEQQRDSQRDSQHNSISANVHKCISMYGPIELDPVVQKVVNTPEFQRLSQLKQLGLAYRVFPGATHTRAAHSIGVCFLAHTVASRLGADAKDLLCVDIAALCHDLGHGPLSHKFDAYMHDIGGRGWTHEEQSIVMLENVLKRLVGADAWQDAGLCPDVDLAANPDVQFIYDLIRGPASTSWRPSDKQWMLDLVSNARTGVDFDKIDYLLRDTVQTFATPAPFDLAKILRGCSKASDGSKIVYDLDAVSELLRMAKHRYFLYDQLYTHPKVVALSLHAIQGLHDVSDMPDYETLIQPDTFVYLTDDYVLQKLREGTDVLDAIDHDAVPELEEVSTSADRTGADAETYLVTDAESVRFRIHCGVRGIGDAFGALPAPKYKTFKRP